MEDLTTGSITRHLLKTTGFMLVTMVFQTLYFLVDLYWVGRLGKEAIAGVGIAGNLTFVVLAITQMLAVGTTTLISHAAGRKEREQAQQVLTQSLLLAGFIGALFLIVACLFAGEPMLRVFSSDPAVIAIGAEYLRLISWSLVAGGIVFVNGSMFQAMGNTIPPLIASFARILVVAIPALLLSRMPGFELRWIWYLSVGATMLQLSLNLYLLRREFRIRLYA